MLRPWLLRTTGGARPRIWFHNPQLQLFAPWKATRLPLLPTPQHARQTASVAHNETIVPLRKQLKEEAKTSRAQKRRGDGKAAVQTDGWELTVGIEIHAQLNAESKLFSSEMMLLRVAGHLSD
jgi:aspartyl-tRNA(Asn)/glutamyl-tRNA(Gln) amidotransferase subunit B